MMDDEHYFSILTLFNISKEYIMQKGKTNQTFDSGRQNLEFEENNSEEKAISTWKDTGHSSPTAH